MNYNLFIFYQLTTNKEEPVLKSIQSLGNITRLGNGFWYVNGNTGAEEALKRISSWMTQQDSALVVDAANNEVFWYNLDDTRAQRIRQNWDMGLGVDQGNEEEEKEAPKAH